MINLIFVLFILFAVLGIIFNGLTVINLIFWAISVILLGISGYIISYKNKDKTKNQELADVLRKISLALILTYSFSLTLMSFDSHNISNFLNANLIIGILFLLISLPFSF